MLTLSQDRSKPLLPQKYKSRDKLRNLKHRSNRFPHRYSFHPRRKPMHYKFALSALPKPHYYMEP